MELPRLTCIFWSGAEFEGAEQSQLALNIHVIWTYEAGEGEISEVW